MLQVVLVQVVLEGILCVLTAYGYTCTVTTLRVLSYIQYCLTVLNSFECTVPFRLQTWPQQFQSPSQYRSQPSSEPAHLIVSNLRTHTSMYSTVVYVQYEFSTVRVAAQSYFTFYHLYSTIYSILYC